MFCMYAIQGKKENEILLSAQLKTKKHGKKKTNFLHKHKQGS